MRTIFHKGISRRLGRCCDRGGERTGVRRSDLHEKPKEKWIAESEMKQKVAEMGYKDIKRFKVTDGKLLRVYSYNKDSKKAEVYFNPVTAEIVK